MTGTRDLQTFALYGQRKHTGSVEAPLFASNGVLFLTAAIGQDALPGYGVVGTSGGSVDTTLSSAAEAGASTIDITSATGITAGTTILQIGVNATSGTVTTAECRLASSLSGTTVTLDEPLEYAHASAAAVISVVSPFTHTITPETYLPSITVEKNLGGGSNYGGESLQYVGARVGKLDVKGQATDTEASFSADITAQWVDILDTPSSVTFLDESPFAFSTFTVEWDDFTYANPTNFNLTVDNGLKPTYTMNGSQDLQFNPGVALHVNGTFDMVYDSLDDENYGFWNQMYTEQEAALSFNMTNAEGFGIGFYMPKVDLKSDQIDPKVTDVIMESVAYEVRRSLSSEPYSIYVTITNGYHLAYTS